MTQSNRIGQMERIDREGRVMTQSNRSGQMERIDREVTDMTQCSRTHPKKDMIGKTSP